MSSEFCSNCGKPRDPKDAFCGECGAARVVNPNSVVNVNHDVYLDNQPKAKANMNEINTKIGIAVVGIIALIALSMVYTMVLGSGNSTVVVKKVVDAFASYDGEAIYKLSHKSSSADYLSYKKEKESEFIDDTKSFFYNQVDRYAARIDVSTRKFNEYVEIVDIEEIEYSDREFDSLLDVYDRYSDVKISKAMIIEVELEAEGEDDSVELTLSIPLIKVGTKWYLDIINLF